MEKDLNQLVERLRAGAGTNLKSVVLYGSAASGEFHPKYSDLNVLCVLERLDSAELEKLHPAASWWAKEGHPAPLVFSLEALRGSTDLFPIELLDIKASRRVLYGEDLFASLDVPLALHRAQLERELRINLIRLRQSYLAGPDKPKRLMDLMTSSLSTFTTLFRHGMVVLGETSPTPKREVVAKVSTLLGCDPGPLLTVLDVREGKRKESELQVAATFRAYLDAVTHVVEEFDRRLGKS